MSNNFESSDFDRDGFVQRLSTLIGDSSYRSFAQRAGISDTVLKKYLKDSIPSLDKAVAIANAGMVSLEWLALGVGIGPDETTSLPSYRIPAARGWQINEPEATYAVTSANDAITWIDSYEVFASAGNGFSNDSELLGNRLPFAESWLAENGLQGKRLALIRSIGDSMSPTIPDRSTPLIEILPDDAVERISDGVYVLRLNGQLLIKRLQSDLAKGLFVKSDNPQYGPIHITADSYPDDFKVIARWTGKLF